MHPNQRNGYLAQLLRKNTHTAGSETVKCLLRNMMNTAAHGTVSRIPRFVFHSEINWSTANDESVTPHQRVQ